MTKYNPGIKVMDKATRDYKERVKALNCLYSFVDIATNDNLLIDGVCQEVANLIPSSWQYPEITCARIVLGDKVFKTINFRTTEWHQSADILVSGRKEGLLEVFSLQATPQIKIGPFLKEEEILLENVARLLGKIIEHKRMEEEMQRLARFPGENPTPVLRVARDGILTYANQASSPILNTWGCEVGQHLPGNWEKLLQSTINSRKQKSAYIKTGDRVFYLAMAPIKDANSVNIYGFDITEQKQLSKNMQSYIKEITLAQEEECKRIAYELHDETIQSLGTIGLEIDYLLKGKTKFSDEPVRRLGHLRSLLDEVLEGLRRLCQHLRPMALDELGLVEALRWLVTDMQTRHTIEASFKVTGTHLRLSPEMELTLFRIVQEALRNVRQHSQASRVEVTVEFAKCKTLSITIKDDGKGFKVPKRISDLAREGKLGLAGMYERAKMISAVLSIQIDPDKGTTITIDLPTQSIIQNTIT